VKKAVEAYWAGKISADDLTKAAADVKKASWTGLKEAKVDLIPRFVPPLPDLISAVNLTTFSAENFPCMTTSWIILLPSMLSRNAIWDTTSPLSISTSPWAVVARLRVSMSPLVR
jgi:O-phosphoseryl-tRNA(Cys) synthetase